MNSTLDPLVGYNNIAINQRCDAKAFKNTVPLSIDLFQDQISSSRNNIQLISRLTLYLEEDDDINILTQNGNRPFERWQILAIVPTSEKQFLHCVQSSGIDLISLPLHIQIPFPLRSSLIKQAISHGTCFEICFGLALQDSSARRQMIGNARKLVHFTRGHNIILTSGAQYPIHQRSPYDLINFGALFGLEAANARRAMTIHPSQLIQHAYTRNKTYKGISHVGSIEEIQKSSNQWKVVSDPSDSTIINDDSVLRNKRKRDLSTGQIHQPSEG